MPVSKDDPNSKITDSESFKFKLNLKSNTNNVDIVNAEIDLLLKYLLNF